MGFWLAKLKTWATQKSSLLMENGRHHRRQPLLSNFLETSVSFKIRQELRILSMSSFQKIPPKSEIVLGSRCENPINNFETKWNWFSEKISTMFLKLKKTRKRVKPRIFLKLKQYPLLSSCPSHRFHKSKTRWRFLVETSRNFEKA